MRLLRGRAWLQRMHKPMHIKLILGERDMLEPSRTFRAFPRLMQYIKRSFPLAEVCGERGGGGGAEALAEGFTRKGLLRPGICKPPRFPVWHTSCVVSGLKLWHLPCADRFRQPRSQVSVKMHSPYYSLDADNVQKGALLELYALCFNDSLNETLYAAGKARLHCAVNSTSYGLTIRAGGFSQKLLRLVETTLCGRKLEKYKADRFLAMHEALLRSYRNSWLKPQAHCSDLRKLLLMPSMPRPSGKEAQLNSCGSEQLMAFVQSFNSVMACELLVSGNTSAEDLMGWAGTVFDGYRLEPQTKVEVDVVQLPVGSATVWMQSAVDSTQSNSAVEIYFQLPQRDTWQWQEDAGFAGCQMCINPPSVVVLSSL